MAINIVGVSGKNFSSVGKIVVCPEKFFDSQNGTLTKNFLATGGGITPEYTGHSTRSVSTSAAAESGIPLEVIIEAADWASAETFRKYYHRPTSRGTFVNTVLSV